MQGTAPPPPSPWRGWSGRFGARTATSPRCCVRAMIERLPPRLGIRLAPPRIRPTCAISAVRYAYGDRVILPPSPAGSTGWARACTITKRATAPPPPPPPPPPPQPKGDKVRHRASDLRQPSPVFFVTALPRRLCRPAGVSAIALRALFRRARCDTSSADARCACQGDVAPGVECAVPLLPEFMCPLNSGRCLDAADPPPRLSREAAPRLRRFWSRAKPAAPSPRRRPAAGSSSSSAGLLDATSIIVPSSSDFYYQSRPTIALAKPGSADPRRRSRSTADWSTTLRSQG